MSEREHPAPARRPAAAFDRGGEGGLVEHPEARALAARRLQGRVSLDPDRDNAARVHYPELDAHDRRLMRAGLEECLRVFRHIESVDRRPRIERVFEMPGYGLNHGLGTCRMGRRRGGSVVRADTLTVHGFDNLMVVDGSVFPGHLSSSEHINITTLALKAAETILLPALGLRAGPLAEAG